MYSTHNWKDRVYSKHGTFQTQITKPLNKLYNVELQTGMYYYLENLPFNELYWTGKVGKLADASNWDMLLFAAKKYIIPPHNNEFRKTI